MLRLDSILRDLPIKTFDKGEVIFQPGDVPEHGYIVMSGVVVVCNFDKKGVERRVLSTQAYELMPSNWLAEPTVPLTYYYRAYTPTICAVVDRYKFPELLMKNPEALYELMLVQDKRMQLAKLRIETLIQTKAEDKLMHMLYYMVNRAARPMQDPEWVELIFSLKQSEFADALGVTRETVARILRQAAKDGIIAGTGKGVYKVNKPKLLKFMNEG